MQIIVLVDNNTIIDRYLLGEPGVSFFVRADGKSILFDAGYSDIFITNARKLGISLYDLDYTVISHGHIDHTWGLEPMIRMYSEAMIEKIGFRKPVLIAHPQAFESKYKDNEVIGSVISEKALELTKKYFKQAGVKKIHACHCTDLKSKLALSEVAELGEVGAGLVLEFK